VGGWGGCKRDWNGMGMGCDGIMWFDIHILIGGFGGHNANFTMPFWFGPGGLYGRAGHVLSIFHKKKKGTMLCRPLITR